ncbi:MAG: hypothetical protein JWN70_1660 [Planctomycetaceae bacterium]|nr:hypothetical protein [Planctomycetaceae bacterium]
MPTTPKTTDSPKKDPSASPDNPGLAATGEFPHSEQQEGKGAGVKEGEKKPKQKTAM